MTSAVAETLRVVDAEFSVSTELARLMASITEGRLDSVQCLPYAYVEYRLPGDVSEPDDIPGGTLGTPRFNRLASFTTLTAHGSTPAQAVDRMIGAYRYARDQALDRLYPEDGGAFATSEFMIAWRRQPVIENLENGSGEPFGVYCRVAWLPKDAEIDFVGHAEAAV